MLLYLFLRLLVEMIQLIRFLYKNRKRNFQKILIQNPPCFHLLPVLQIYKQIYYTQIIVDIHNFGYSIFKTKFRLLSKVMNFLEIFWIRMTSDKILAVSEAMSQELKKKWKVKDVVVLYDRPNLQRFRKLSLQEKHDFFFQFN